MRSKTSSTTLKPPGASPGPSVPRAEPLKAERVQLTGEPLAEQLKAERVQLTAGRRQRLKAERVQEALRALPGWQLAAGGRAIDRLRQFPDALAAAAYASFLAQLAVGTGQPMGIELAGPQVAITLRGLPPRGTSGGLDEATLDLARMAG